MKVRLQDVEGEAGGLADYDGQSSHISASPSAPDLSGEAATGNGADAVGGQPRCSTLMVNLDSPPPTDSHLRRKS